MKAKRAAPEIAMRYFFPVDEEKYARINYRILDYFGPNQRMRKVKTTLTTRQVTRGK